jgi:hypothetical protein
LRSPSADASGDTRFDLGTADELALDVLINMLSTFSRECVGLRMYV